ncbi:hypothetical protein Tco_0051209 [Tanacetum coccineum]
MPPPSYRGCWHGVSRGFFLESCHDRALDERALQAALPFFTHAILLDRAFAHCPRFPTAAPRGSPGRVSVPVWLIIRKDQLSIIGLLPENNVRLACVKHIASVPSEPGSNSSFDYDLALQCLVIDILEKLVKSRQTLSKAMVARNGFSQKGKAKASNGEERRLGRRAIFSYGLHLPPDPEIENPTRGLLDERQRRRHRKLVRGHRDKSSVLLQVPRQPLPSPNDCRPPDSLVKESTEHLSGGIEYPDRIRVHAARPEQIEGVGHSFWSLTSKKKVVIMKGTVILKLPCLVEKKRTKVRSLAVLFSVANWDRSPARSDWRNIGYFPRKTSSLKFKRSPAPLSSGHQFPWPSDTGQASASIHGLTTLRRPVFLVNSRPGLVTAEKAARPMTHNSK